MTSLRSSRRLVTTIPGSSGQPDYCSGSSSAVPNMPSSTLSSVSWPDRTTRVIWGSRANEAHESVPQRIGEAIASVIAVVDPELVVLGGAIGSNPALLAPVRATVAQLVPLTARIETSRLGDRAALHGAIAVALREARAALFTRAAR